MMNRCLRMVLTALFCAWSAGAPTHAEESKRIPITLDESTISFEGDDSFILGRYITTPNPKGLIRLESFQIDGGWLNYSIVTAQYMYSLENYTNTTALISWWKNNAYIKSVGLSAERDDVQRSKNSYGNYFFVVKGNEKAVCGLAVQPFSTSAGFAWSTMSGGASQRLELAVCRHPSRSSVQQLEHLVQDIMLHYRADDGALNKAKAVARSVATTQIQGATSPPLTEIRSGTVSFQWGELGSSSGKIEFDDLGGKGSLTVTLRDKREPCHGFWALSRGAYGTNQLPEGTWTLSCPDNLSAGGTYMSNKPGQGNGSGNDSAGRKISFTFGS